MLRPLLASLLLLLAACASPTPDRTLRVDRDMGGFYLERITEMAEITLADQAIEIRGTCASACTLYLGMPDRTCVHPRARLGFHGPQAYRNGRQQAVPEPFRSEVVQTIAAHYPPAFRAWFLEHAAHVSGDVVWMSGREAIALGATPCP